MTDPARARLGAIIRARRNQLGFRRGDRGVSRSSWRNVESGKHVRPSTMALICAALGWTPESPDLVLAGGEPVLIEDRDADLREEVARLREEVAELRAEAERREAS